MKKFFVLLFIVIMTASLAACTNRNEETATDNVVEIVTPVEVDEPLSIPTGAGLFRGEVEYVTIADGLNTIVLRQVPGTDFGAERITVLIDAETRSDFAITDVNEGDHIEVYYHIIGIYGGHMPEEVTAIVLRMLPPASASVFVGTVVEITAYPTGGYLRLFIDEDEPYEIVVGFGNEYTQLYLDMANLEPGDRISVFTDGSSNTSDSTLHVNALEIRLAPDTSRFEGEERILTYEGAIRQIIVDVEGHALINIHSEPFSIVTYWGAPGFDFDDIEVSIENGILQVRGDISNGGAYDPPSTFDFILNVTADLLERVELNGWSTVVGYGTFMEDELSLVVNGPGNIIFADEAVIISPNVNISLNGSGDITAAVASETTVVNLRDSGGDITLSGTTNNLEIDFEAIGDIDARNLASGHAKVMSDGVGNIYVNANQTLDIFAGGAVTVTHFGDAEPAYSSADTATVVRGD
ncbi:MAG: DUF2807 domain-containing protein [Defluviitaleaceae bacterium]|nr:DUF2807 domain-containing protein [Defluviitaleaceae bacterium]